jgi:hypothetical protein
MAKRCRNTFDLAAGLGLASLHTGITLFYRLPMLAASFSATGKERMRANSTAWWARRRAPCSMVF